MESASRLAHALGHSFADPGLLRQALTHPSAILRGRKGHGDYERLEFLGDRVLGLVIADWLLVTYPDADAGHLARRFNELVRRETLAEVARETGINLEVRMADGERATGGADKPAILADVCEALIAALYLDGGLGAAESFVHRHWSERVTGLKRAPKDPKTAIQEWAHAAGIEPPVYRVVAVEGPDHAPAFTIEAAFARGRAVATGPSKKEAERRAAERLLGDMEGSAND
ncbi:MAG: ribonuclease III [Pseudomonadota bacterium]|nr:ribonuclease III [Pseudomonadota bacterium]